MALENTISAFINLGNIFRNFKSNCPDLNFPEQLEAKVKELEALCNELNIYNPWFTPENVKDAIISLGEALQEEKMEQWLTKYNIPDNCMNPKTIGVIMAGNIPLVGFHDFLCVLISGNKIKIKLSSDDNKLMPIIAEIIILLEPSLASHILFSQGQLKNVDAYIATGSDNTSRYFDYYFRKFPKIIRKNRNSVAILTGYETKNELEYLAQDVFKYFGLGCRNITKLLLPEKYDFKDLFNAFEQHNGIINHHKYANNYEYNKAIYLVNKEKHLDNGFLLLKEDLGISSPIGALYYEYYDDISSVEMFLKTNDEKIQCVIGNLKEAIPFGMAQKPKLWDYADNVDTLSFLLEL